MKNKNKKNESKILVVWALCALLGGVCGFVIMQCINGAFSEEELFKYELLIFALAIVWIYVSIFLSTVLHEIGHLIFGRLTGYKFLSFRIGNIMLVKIDGKLKIKKFNIPGTGGQCLMAPPEPLYGEFPVMLYNLGGVTINILAAIASVIVYVCVDNIVLGVFFLIFAFVNAFSGLMNGIPMTVGTVNNDAKNAFFIKNNKTAKTAFFLQLKMNEAMLQGVRLKDMPEDWFNIFENDGCSDSLSSSIEVFYCQRLIDAKKFDNAIAEIEKVTAKNNILEMYKNIILCDLIYCKLVTGCDKEEIRALLNPKQKKFIKLMSKSIGILRTKFAIALLYDKDEGSASKILRAFEKISRKYPYKADAEGESELVEIVKQMQSNVKKER